LKQQFTFGDRESLDSSYDRYQNLLSMLELYEAEATVEDANLKFLRSLPSAWHVVATMIRGQPGLDTMDFDDLYNNLRVYEHEMKGNKGSSSHNIAFVSSENKSSTSTKSSAHRVQSTVVETQNPCTTLISTTSSHTPNSDDVLCSFFVQQATLPVTYQEDLLQIDDDAMEEIDIRWQVAMIAARIKKFMNKTGSGIDFKAKQGIAFDKSKIECFNCQRTGHFARECKFAKYQANKMIEQPKPKVERKEVPIVVPNVVTLIKRCLKNMKQKEITIDELGLRYLVTNCL
jgi:hypothetical protein